MPSKSEREGQMLIGLICLWTIERKKRTKKLGDDDNTLALECKTNNLWVRNRGKENQIYGLQN